MKYIHIIIFLLTHDLTQLKEYWQSEVIKNKDFKWRRLFRRYRKSLDMNTQYWFWWRLANEMFLYGTKTQKNVALLINKNLFIKYNVDIKLNIKIGIKPFISHFSGIVIDGNSEIGDNFLCRQNVTIGCKSHPLKVIIGNNVSVGASSVILGGQIKIGDNVNIGALSFIDKDIPNNCTVYTKKENKMILKAH